MQRDRYNQIVNDLHKKRMNLAVKKGHDYSGEDILANFKRVSTAAHFLRINSNTSVGYAMFMTLMKIDRLMNLMGSGKEPLNESLDDTFMDLHNYVDLARACYIEIMEALREQAIPDNRTPAPKETESTKEKVVGSITTGTPQV